MNTLQPPVRADFLRAGLDWVTGTFKIIPVDSSYTHNEAHDFLADIGAGARILDVGDVDALASKDDASGYASSDPTTWESVPDGDTIEGAAIIEDTGVEGTSRYAAWYDTDASGQAIATPTNGGNILVTPAALGWFRA